MYVGTCSSCGDGGGGDDGCGFGGGGVSSTGADVTSAGLVLSYSKGERVRVRTCCELAHANFRHGVNFGLVDGASRL